MNSDNNSENWSEYWAREGAGGEVFSNQEAQSNPAVVAWWKQNFEPLAEGSAVLDVAAGGGSIYASLDQPERWQLHAVDYSASAIEILQSRLPAVACSVSGAENLGFDDQSFDMVVSQFGIEYAGESAFTEAARVVKVGGVLSALVHIKGGHIERLAYRELKGAQWVEEIGFIDRAIALNKAYFGQDAEQRRATIEAFKPVERELAQAVQAQPSGVHTYLYAGFRKMFENRKAYDAKDINDWLENMRTDVARSVSRLGEISRAAQSRKDMDTILQQLGRAGLHEVELEELRDDKASLAIAWALRARKSAVL